MCTPKGWEAILRIVRDEKDPDAVKSFQAHREYEKAIQRLITSLSWHDFEDLIDLVLARTGSAHHFDEGQNHEGVDVEAKNPAVGEIAFVQVEKLGESGDPQRLGWFAEYDVEMSTSG